MFSYQFSPSFATLPQMKSARPSFPKFFMASTQLCSPSKEAKELKRLSCANSMAPEKVEIFKSLEDWARDNVVTLLKPVEKSWQPADFLPDSTTERFLEQINEIRERTKEIPDHLLAVLVGNMITEEALPAFQTRISSIEVYHDDTGTDNSPWAIWARGWSSEEDRHGDLLKRYLYLSGRVNMRQVEKTIHYMLGTGMNLGTGTNPYHWSIYTAFQERATFFSHGNTAKLAMKYGDTKLAQICGTIAADEKRHETGYSRIVGKLFELDPSGSMVAFADMLKIKITMPGHLMYDGQDLNLFGHYASVAMRIGVYTTMDYINVLEHLVDLWNVKKLTGLTSEAKMAQDYVCGLPERLRKMEERAQARVKEASTVPFSWVFKTQV